LLALGIGEFVQFTQKTQNSQPFDTSLNLKLCQAADAVYIHTHIGMKWRRANGVDTVEWAAGLHRDRSIGAVHKPSLRRMGWC